MQLHRKTNTHSRTHKGDSLCLFTQMMCCTCPSRGFVRIAQLFVLPAHTAKLIRNVHARAYTLTPLLLFPRRQHFEKFEREELLFITSGSAYTFSRLLPWTATDCILKCLPVGSESRKKCVRDPNIWSILKLNTRYTMCVYQMDRMNRFFFHF